jgi:acyl-CoA thioesterase
VIGALFEQVEKERYAQKLKLRLIRCEPGYALVEMAHQEDMRNIFGMTHGCAIFSLIDEAFQISCNSHGTIAVALNMTITYHRPPGKGSTLRAESMEIHRTKKTATYDIKVKDENRLLIASCMALAYRKKEKLPFLEGA